MANNSVFVFMEEGGPAHVHDYARYAEENRQNGH